jgi:hypothetical protein
MTDFRILNVLERDCHLVVCVEHYKDDQWWFTENYCWPGVEGIKRKRLVDSEGWVLMDNGVRAPFHPQTAVEARPGNQRWRQYLPRGRDWARADTPHMDEGSILETIRSHHAKLLAAGFTGGTVDTLGPHPFSERDRAGCPQLLAKFRYLIGRQE